MKKIIYSLLVLAMTAFTFSSCEDVPAPYDTPNKPESPEVTTDGTEANPYTVSDAKLAGSGTEVFVKAYIVGFVPDKTLSEAIFGATGETVAVSNVIIAASADETSITNCMPIQLPSGDVRSALNLKDNPSNLKQEVLLCGNIENYFGATGLKSVVYAKIGGKEYGKKPGTDTPDNPSTGEAKGDGSKDNPFNSIGALNYTKALAADAVSENSIYIKGKVREVKEQYGTQYGNATVTIADDDNSDVFTIYRAYYFDNKKWAEGGSELKVGDEVVYYGQVVNYKGNTPETQQGKAYLISLNGKTSDGGSVGPAPDPTPSGDGMTSTAIVNGKVGDNSLATNGYGSQNATDESTWYTWNFDNITYKGAKICISNEKYGKGIQMQGADGDETKQGFIFNSTAFSKEIKTITVYLSTTATSTYAPSYCLYAGKAANGRDSKVTGTSTNETSGDWKTYTEVYDMSSYNTKYFTLWNNSKGALYIEKIVVTLK